MLEPQQQFYMQRLLAWNGHHRQDALEQLADCYETVLFPMLLKRLSDYVPINREMSAQHLVRWSERTDFSDLCVQYFEDVVAIQKRIRIVDAVEDLLLRKTSENLIAIENVFLKQQGKRPRLFLDYIQRYAWLDQIALLAWCERAKDQRVRGYWLNHLIAMDDVEALKTALYSTPYRNIKMKLLPILYEKNAFSVQEYLLFLQQSSLSIMDFAIFALKKQNFDFVQYFNQQPFAHLTVQHQRLRLYQWVLLQFAQDAFICMLRQISQQHLQFSVLTFARNQGYLSSVDYLYHYVDLGGQLTVETLRAFHQKERNKLSPDDLSVICRTLCTTFTFSELMLFAQDYTYWDQFLWLLHHQKAIQTAEEHTYFLEQFCLLIREGQYQYYPPAWQQEAKQQLLAYLTQQFVYLEQQGVVKEANHLRLILQK